MILLWLSLEHNGLGCRVLESGELDRPDYSIEGGCAERFAQGVFIRASYFYSLFKHLARHVSKKASEESGFSWYFLMQASKKGLAFGRNPLSGA